MEGNLHLERQRCEIRQNHLTLRYFREASPSGVGHGPWQTLGAGTEKRKLVPSISGGIVSFWLPTSPGEEGAHSWLASQGGCLVWMLPKIALTDRWGECTRKTLILNKCEEFDIIITIIKAALLRGSHGQSHSSDNSPGILCEVYAQLSGGN